MRRYHIWIISDLSGAVWLALIAGVIHAWAAARTMEIGPMIPQY